MYDLLPMDGPELAPISGNPPKQLVLFLHGVGADGNDLIGLAPEFANLLPDAQFVSPNAPFHCDMAPMGRQWFSLQSRETAHMLTGINAAAPILNRYIDEILAKYSLGLEQLVIIGFSQGTMMALHTLLQRPESCAAIIGYSGAIIGSAAFKQQIVSKPPVCLIHGEEDIVVPFAALPDAESALTQAGVDVEAHAIPELGHSIDPQGIQAAHRFIERVLSLQTAA